MTHKTTLQGVVYQLDVALQSPDTQKCGLVFIYDMSGSKYSNFDYELSQKILTMLKVSNDDNVLSSASLDKIFSVATRQISINHTTMISHAKVSDDASSPVTKNSEILTFI